MGKFHMGQESAETYKVQQTKVFQDRRILPSPFRYAREGEGELSFTVVGYGWLSLNEAVKVLRGPAMSGIVGGVQTSLPEWNLFAACTQCQV